MVRFLFPFLLISSALPAMAQTPATPDCTKASSGVEKALCSDEKLLDLDKALKQAFLQARGRVDRDALKALDKDQKDFMAERELVVSKGEMSLTQYMQNRLSFLESIESPAWGRDVSAFIGTWRNSLGEVRITPDSSGGVVIAISTLSPAESTWICDIEGGATPKSGRLQFSEDDVKITIARRGSALIVGDVLPQGDGGRPFCGANGYIDGAFFKVK